MNFQNASYTKQVQQKGRRVRACAVRSWNSLWKIFYQNTNK